MELGMKEKNIGVFARWAIVGLVAGFAFSGIGMSIARQEAKAPQPMPPAVSVGGVKVRGQFVYGELPKLHLTIDVSNSSSVVRPFNATLTLRRNEFTGNLDSRAIDPSDVKITVVETRSITGTVAPGKTESFNIVFRTKGIDTTRNGRTSYFADLAGNGWTSKPSFWSPSAPRAKA
jgi:hypothetical protein